MTVHRTDEFFEALAQWITDAGHTVTIWEHTGPGPSAFPYVVLDPHWVSEPDVGQLLLADPSAQYIGVQVNSYGRAVPDALWLDQQIYSLLIDGPIPVLGVEILYREADHAPTLTWVETGAMLSKHWYRMTFR